MFVLCTSCGEKNNIEARFCQNCGEVLKSFVANCPSCGFELRDTNTTSLVREFTLKLEAIESRRSLCKGQYAQHKQTQSANIGAFQVEKQAEVGVVGANALGQMGANGAGNINLSDGGTGFNMAVMMASMAVGGAVGQNIAGSMNNMMSGINQMTPTTATPPPVPVVTYSVAVDGQATGPFDIVTLQQMVVAGQLSANSLVWKKERENGFVLV